MQGQGGEVVEGLPGSTLVKALRPGGAAQDREDLQVDQLGCCQLLSLKSAASLVAVLTVVGQGRGEH